MVVVLEQQVVLPEQAERLARCIRLQRHQPHLPENVQWVYHPRKNPLGSKPPPRLREDSWRKCNLKSMLPETEPGNFADSLVGALSIMAHRQRGADTAECRRRSAVRAQGDLRHGWPKS